MNGGILVKTTDGIANPFDATDVAEFLRACMATFSVSENGLSAALEEKEPSPSMVGTQISPLSLTPSDNCLSTVTILLHIWRFSLKCQVRWHRILYYSRQCPGLLQFSYLLNDGLVVTKWCMPLMSSHREIIHYKEAACELDAQ